MENKQEPGFEEQKTWNEIPIMYEKPIKWNKTNEMILVENILEEACRKWITLM